LLVRIMPTPAAQTEAVTQPVASGPRQSPGSGRFVKKGKRRSLKGTRKKALSLTDAKGVEKNHSAGTKKRKRHDEPEPAVTAKKWTPSTTRQLKAARLKDALINHRGRSRGYLETAAFCSVVLGLYLAHQSGVLGTLAAVVDPEFSRFYYLAGDLVGMGHDLARTTFNWFYDHDGRKHARGDILVNTSARGRAVAKYKLRDAWLLQPEHWDAIDTFILECHGDKGGGRVTIARIREMLREKFSPKAQEGAPAGSCPPSFDVSRSAVRYCLRHQLGYKWGKIRKKPRKRDVDRPATLRSYLLRYSAALALERAEQAVIVYFDEVCTVCHQLISLLSVRRFESSVAYCC
jgi:hypothetical protein